MLEALNSLLCFQSRVSCFYDIVSDFGIVLAVALKSHSHTMSLLYSLPVFLSLRFVGPFLKFSHWFLIAGMALNMQSTSSFSNVKVCHIFFTVNLSFYTSSLSFIFELRSSNTVVFGGRGHQ